MPEIDGIMTTGEWRDAAWYHFFFTPTSNHPADRINVFIKHNDTHLFMCYDVEPDNSSEPNDAGFLYLDLENNGTQDVRFQMTRGGSVSIYQRTGPSLSSLEYAMGFGFNLTAQEKGRNHTIIEWIISINRTTNYTGQNLSGVTSLPFGINPIGVVFGGYGTLEPEWIYGNQTYIADIVTELDSSDNASFYADLLLVKANLDLSPLLLLMQQGAGDQLIIPLTLVLIGIGAAAVLIFVFLKKRA